MCGLHGIFHYRADAGDVVEPEALSHALEVMRLRGPDARGQWLSEDRRVGLAHCRLAIIDTSSAGTQPMASSDGALHIVFNGEIYNYQELREELAASGTQFRTGTDTEVLLALYRAHGAQMLRRLRGMFAFALWDGERRELLLARDPFGIKPLYFSDSGGAIRFSSQVKALLSDGAVSREQDPVGACGFFLLGSVPEPYTLYRDIRQLPAGGMLTVARGGRVVESHYLSTEELLAVEAEAAASEAAWDSQRRLAAAIEESVRYHLIADVPVACFLSAGVDSNTIAHYAAPAAEGRLRTLTLAFEEFTGTASDEAQIAKRSAAHFGTEHTTIVYTRADFKRFTAGLFSAMDQPTIDGVNTYLISHAAARAGMKVALSGLGGDELFAGYPSFHQIPRLVSALSSLRLPTAVGRGVRLLSAPLVKHFTSPKWAGLFEYGADYPGAYLLRRGLFLPWELPSVLPAEVVREGWPPLERLLRSCEPAHGTPLEKVRAFEVMLYLRNQLLRDADWAGMAHSLEIRVPFVDPVLYRTVLAAPTPYTKKDLIELLPEPVAASLRNRPKTGFAVPVREWFLEDEQKERGTPLRGLRGWALEVYQRHSAEYAA